MINAWERQVCLTVNASVLNLNFSEFYFLISRHGIKIKVALLGTIFNLIDRKTINKISSRELHELHIL